MSDPVRLLEEGDALEVEVLRSAVGDVAPGRVRERVLGMALAGAVTTGAAGASGATGAGMGAGVKGASVAAVGVAKWVGVVVVVGAAVAGAVTYGGGGEGERVVPLTVAPVAPVVAVPKAVVAPPKNLAPPAVPVPTAPVAAPRTAPPPPAARGTALLDELGLLDGAREALEAGDVALATQRLDRHDLEYSQGQLASDALALRVEVYAKRQDDPKVRELATRFLAKYPEHPQAPKVRGLLERAGGTNP